MKKFNNPLDPDDLNIKAAIRTWTFDFLKLTPDFELEIIEHECSDASCLHAETVLKIKPSLRGIEATEGVERFFKIAKPLTFVRKLDVQHMKEIIYKK
jgi:hypothetical protein